MQQEDRDDQQADEPARRADQPRGERPGGETHGGRASGASAGAVPPSPAPRPRRTAVPIRSTKARESHSPSDVDAAAFAFPPGVNGQQHAFDHQLIDGPRARRQVRAVARVEGRQGEGIDRQPRQAKVRASVRVERAGQRRGDLFRRRTGRHGVEWRPAERARAAHAKLDRALRRRRASGRDQRSGHRLPEDGDLRQHGQRQRVAARSTVSVSVCTAAAMQPLLAVIVRVDVPAAIRRAADQTRRGIEGKTGRQTGDRQNRRRTPGSAHK